MSGGKGVCGNAQVNKGCAGTVFSVLRNGEGVCGNVQVNEEGSGTAATLQVRTTVKYAL